MVITPVLLLSRVLVSGKTNIKIKISIGGQSRYIATQYFIEPCFFKKNGTISSDHPNAEHLNLDLKQIVLNYEKKLIGQNVSALPINRIAEILREKTKMSDFLAYFEKFIADKKEMNTRTAEIYQAAFDKIKKFDHRSPLLFEDISAGWLKRFQNWMMKDGLKTNAISIHLRCIRAVINAAIDDDVISLSLYPFRRFKIKNAATAKKSLTADQLRQIRDFESPFPRVQFSRDLFMLSFYLIGTNNDDLYHLKTIKAGRIVFARAKTHREYNIKIEPEAQILIDKLKGKKHLLDCSDRYATVRKMTTSLNRGLKLIMPGLTMYHARHTWATMAKNDPIRAADDDISAALGHTKKTTTEIYINRDPRIVDKLNREVINFANGFCAWPRLRI